MHTLPKKKIKKSDLFSYPSQCKSLKHEITHFQRMYVPHNLNTNLTAAAQQVGIFILLLGIRNFGSESVSKNK